MKKNNHSNWIPKWNKRYGEISLYVIGTCAVLFLLWKLFSHVDAFFEAIGSSLAWIGSVLKPVALGFIIAYLLYPLVAGAEKRLMKRAHFQKRPKSAHYMAVALTLIGIALAFAALITLLVVTITQQFVSISSGGFQKIVESFMNSLGQLYSGVLHWLETMNVESAQAEQFVESIRNMLTSRFGSGASSMVETLNSVKSTGATILFSILFAVYFMIDWPGLHHYWKRVVDILVGKNQSPHLYHIGQDIGGVFAGYIRGQMSDAIFMMIMVSVSFSIARIPYGIVIGVLTGVGNMVPYLGPIVGYGLTIITGIISGDMQSILVGIIILVIIQAVDAAVVNPKLLGKSIQIHPMLVTVGVIAGNKAGGFIGMLVAVPIAALLKMWFERGLAKIREHRAFASEAAGEAGIPSGGDTPARDRQKGDGRGI